jgi:hypothetical protein
VTSAKSAYKNCVLAAGGSCTTELVSKLISSGSTEADRVTLGLVERRLDRCLSRCPLTIGTDCGGCRFTCADVMSRKVVRRPLSMALHHVESCGENKDA